MVRKKRQCNFINLFEHNNFLTQNYFAKAINGNLTIPELLVGGGRTR